MLCLGLETSCDETALALVAEGRLLAESLASQDAHALFGGVVPEIASREHQRLLPALFRDLLAKSGVRARQIEAVAAARGPGLLGSLLVGLSFAKGLCLSLGVPLVGINHLHAHLLAPGLERPLRFPALGLLVSGGHTHTYRMDSAFEFRLFGLTLDDAAGEAFDKLAKLLNFPYPGGRFVDELGRGAEPDQTLFPRAFIDTDSLDFSFSGLKTAAAQYLSRHPKLCAQRLADPLGPGGDLVDRGELATLCASFAWSVADTLRIKVERALARERGVAALVVAGGVAANSRVRAVMRDLAESFGLELFLPSPGLCTDNAAMIAYAGELYAEAGFAHDLDLDAIPRGRAVPEDWARRP